jgi:ubiquitin-conjugating enzyme (huntingtin interacting protein 2)
MTSKGRIRKEIQDLSNDKASGVSVETDPYNDMHLKGTLRGPDDTPYAGGTFEVDIVIPSDYPFTPPKMKFITKLWHPNVSSQTGAICLDILKDQWSPALTMKTALLSLQALMCSPEPNDPQDAVVANMYKDHYEEFKATAANWTAQYAKPAGEGATKQELHPSVRKLMEMGFDEAACKRALADCKGDENSAIEKLLSSM